MEWQTDGASAARDTGGRGGDRGRERRGRLGHGDADGAAVVGGGEVRW